VLGHITALAISDMMMIGVSFVSFSGDRIDGTIGYDNTWFACCTVSLNLSFHTFC
jgi:hypothetical protein